MSLRVSVAFGVQRTWLLFQLSQFLLCVCCAGIVEKRLKRDEDGVQVQSGTDNIAYLCAT